MVTNEEKRSFSALLWTAFPAETSKKIFQPPTIFSENGRKLVDQNTLESHGKLGWVLDNPLLGLQEVIHQGLTEIKCTGIFRTFFESLVCHTSKIEFVPSSVKATGTCFFGLLPCTAVTTSRLLKRSKTNVLLQLWNYKISKVKQFRMHYFVSYCDKNWLFLFCTLCLMRSYIKQEAKKSFASPDNSFYGKLHIVQLLYQ